MLRSRNKTSDPYDLFHLSLNKLPDEGPDTPPKTEWLNMGFWRGTSLFPEACRALALKLVQAARIKQGAKVLDVGHGSGESLIFLLSDSSVPRPSSLTGITSLAVHHDRSRERVSRLQVPSEVEVNLYHGDAVYRPQAINHPLSPNSIINYDGILALDCAYHFKTRKDFLRQSFEHLTPGGRIALADICLDASRLKSWKRYFLFSVLRVMPLENGISMDQYVEELKNIGYVNVTIEDISEDVFPGFVRFLKGRGLGWKIFGHSMEWLYRSGARFVVASGGREL
ncbi:S-adenosyl-L-methionine-dependent methyltransferase [Dendrothele bispora CBS 962.96]|uniref:S-adenosyl-L-methionine-dependent methyltransferase n=1 Tax=Dendrothele bispora (strain CBS 962.96) TaxID=1314807 RepID=A0A4V4HI17_DENBC|nr:S-adenosyl-L-methionine-dependent methyltransferase [Dendrothele bispora CBS 962.96]